MQISITLGTRDRDVLKHQEGHVDRVSPCAFVCLVDPPCSPVHDGGIGCKTGGPAREVASLYEQLYEECGDDGIEVGLVMGDDHR